MFTTSASIFTRINYITELTITSGVIKYSNGYNYDMPSNKFGNFSLMTFNEF